MASKLEARLSDRLTRLEETSDALVWPDRVTTAMAELKDVTARVTGFIEQVSGDASSLGDLATAMGGEVVDPEAVEQVARRVAREIDAFKIPDPRPDHPAQTSKWHAGRLSEMRAALVEPYVLEVAVGRDQRAAARRPVLIVASDADRALLAFDPEPQGDFVVVWRRPSGDVLSNIRGGAVECFLAI